MTMRDTEELLSAGGGVALVNGGSATTSPANGTMDAKKIKMEKGDGETDNTSVNNNNNNSIVNQNNLNNGGTTTTTATNNNNNGASVSPPESPVSSPSNQIAVVSQNGERGGLVVVNNNNTHKPSRVVHLRNVPNEVTEPEIIQLGLSFGRITNMLQLRGKSQAFLEMADENQAIAMVECYTKQPPTLRGRTIYVQYSNHRELKTDPQHANNTSVLQAAQMVLTQGVHPLALAQIQHTQQHSPDGGGGLSPQHALMANGAGPLLAANAALAGGGTNTVLRVIVENQLYPVTLDILNTIFSRFGKVLKIVTFSKNKTFQALIQFADILGAQAAKMALDGQNIYNNCCTLCIEFSKLPMLNVRFNNDKSRDYTNPNLPSGETAIDNIGLANSLGLLANPFGPPQAIQASLSYGAHPQAAALQLGGGFAALTHQAQAALGVAGIRLPHPGSCVLLISNLNEQLITPDALFTLFGVYGDVMRVKILFNKKDSALIQMAEPQQAQLAMTHLDKINLYGKPIRVMQSKHHLVQLPKEGQPDAGLTKDYINSTLHRFKKPGSKNYQNIYPPSATLHLSNIPPTTTEVCAMGEGICMSPIPTTEQLKEAFSTTGCVTKIIAFKFFPKDRKMALIQLPTVEEAVSALIKMHNYQLSESSHLRVSFSKSTI